MLNFDACDLVEGVASRKARSLTWFGSMSGEVTGGEVTTLCASVQGRPPGTTCLRDRQTHFGIFVIDFSVAFMHARTDDEIYVKVPSGIKSWNLMAAVNGTRKASKHLARVLILTGW